MDIHSQKPHYQYSKRSFICKSKLVIGLSVCNEFTEEAVQKLSKIAEVKAYNLFSLAIA